MIKVSSEEREKRYNTCKSCDDYKRGRMLLGADKCLNCGCVMAIKTWVKAAKCPVNKW